MSINSGEIIVQIVFPSLIHPQHVLVARDLSLYKVNTYILIPITFDFLATLELIINT